MVLVNEIKYGRLPIGVLFKRNRYSLEVQDLLKTGKLQQVGQCVCHIWFFYVSQMINVLC